MVDGKKRVERIPEEWVEQIRPLVEQGREFKRRYCRGLRRQRATAGALASTVHEEEAPEEMSGPRLNLRVGLFWLTMGLTLNQETSDRVSEASFRRAWAATRRATVGAASNTNDAVGNRTKPFADNCAAPPCPSGLTVPVANSTSLKSTSAMSLACPIY